MILPRSTFGNVRDFYLAQFRHDASMVQDTLFFEQLKPRL